jgi:glutathione peroxidase-family protein
MRTLWIEFAHRFKGTRVKSGMSQPIYEIDVQKNDGSQPTPGDHKGEVLLIVKVASNCGLTPQGAALEKAHEAFAPRGLRILGFPANDFMGQEPGRALSSRRNAGRSALGDGDRG